MATYEVTTDLIIHCKVKVRVDADSADDAIDLVAEQMPSNFDDSAKLWRASVNLKPPKGVDCKFVKAIHFEQASGDDKARKVT